MSKWTKEELEEMMFEIVDELDLSEEMLEKHGPMGTPVPQLVREILAHKDGIITKLRVGMKDVTQLAALQAENAELKEEITHLKAALTPIPVVGGQEPEGPVFVTWDKTTSKAKWRVAVYQKGRRLFGDDDYDLGWLCYWTGTPLTDRINYWLPIPEMGVK